MLVASGKRCPSVESEETTLSDERQSRDASCTRRVFVTADTL